MGEKQCGSFKLFRGKSLVCKVLQEMEYKSTKYYLVQDNMLKSLHDCDDVCNTLCFTAQHFQVFGTNVLMF